jgi:hypothetical protein
LPVAELGLAEHLSMTGTIAAVGSVVLAMSAFVLLMSVWTARKLFRQNVAVYDSVHRWVELDTADPPPVPTDGYDRMRAALGELGIERVASVENEVVSRVYPEFRTYLDLYLSRTLELYVATYRIHHPALDLQVLDVETWFEDGAFLLTSNSPHSLTLDSPPQIDRRVEQDQSPAQLVESHRASLAALQGNGKRARRVKSAEEVLEAQAQFSRLECDYRRSIGYLKPEELKRLSAGLLMLPGTMAFIQWAFTRQVAAHRKKGSPVGEPRR